MYTTSSCSSCTMRTALDPVRPPGPSNQAYLSLHTLEATQAKTFRACSSPAPTQIKPHPTPAILGQESVHTTLSTTHHECIDNTPLKQYEKNMTQHDTHKASNHPVNRSSYINQGTYQLGFSISPLMSALPKDDLKATRKTHSSA